MSRAKRLLARLSVHPGLVYETSVRREVLGGLATFVTMSYIVPANAIILHDAGMSFGGVVVATILVAGVFSILTGLLAKLPYAMAPYMGENAFFAYNMAVIILALGYSVEESWRIGLGIVLWAGILFLLVSLTGIGSRIASSLPRSIIATWAAAIGFYIMYVGFQYAHFIPSLCTGEPIAYHVTALFIALAGTVLTLILVIKDVPGHMLVGFGFTLALALAARHMGLLVGIGYTIPVRIGDIAAVAAAADPLRALTHPVLIALIYMLFLIDLIDTMGTSISLSFIGRLMDKRGRPYMFDRLLAIDSLSSIASSLLGSSTSGVYIESAAGLTMGARTGLASVVTGLCFLALLPGVALISNVDIVLLRLAVAPSLIAIGLIFATSLGNIDFSDWAEASTAILTIASMVFTGSLAIGFAASMIVYPVSLLATGRKEEINKTFLTMLLFGALLLAFLPLRLG